MSIWGDIRRRSDGKMISQEEFNLVYPGKSKQGDITLVDGTYKDCVYKIGTTGEYPIIRFDVNRPLSVFAGAGMVQIETDDGEKFNLNRVSDGSGSTYTYEFNKDGDYIQGHHPGKQYSVETLDDIAKVFIDIILDREDNLSSRMGKD